MSDHFGVVSVCELLGGLALFLYGMSLAVEGLRTALGHHLRAIIALFTGNRALSAAAGATATVTLQSSSATTGMLVGLADSGLITLERSLAVIVGATIGATITIQLIAFDVKQYGLILLFLGFILRTLLRHPTWRASGRLLMGFGFVFYGMFLMKTGTLPLSQSHNFLAAFTSVAENPILAILIAAAFTAIVQSSAAALGVAMAIASQAATSPESAAVALKLAVPLVVGANLGTCSTALFASAATGRKGKQVAVAHLVVKLLGAIIVIPFIGPFTDLVVTVTKWMTSAAPVGREIANAHTIIVVMTGVIVLPFTRTTAALVRWMVKAPAQGPPGGFGGKLDLALLASPELALARTRAEVQRCAQATAQMFNLAATALLNEDMSAVDKARRADDAIDLSTAAVTDYLSRLPADRMSKSEAAQRSALLYIAWDLEYIGDVVSKDIAHLAEKLLSSGGEMSIEGITQLRKFWAEVGADFGLLVEALESGDALRSRVILDHEPQVEATRRRLHDAHLDRISRGVGEEREASVVYMDTVVAIRQVHYYLADAARSLQA